MRKACHGEIKAQLIEEENHILILGISESHSYRHQINDLEGHYGAQLPLHTTLSK